mmetsp:Transcript_33965/g.71490  ORF Transcript_33965/g.71490 Transcript_33965/m.71490 type:complete len:257 (-) Transcript_33965:112-882(-)
MSAPCDGKYHTLRLIGPKWRSWGQPSARASSTRSCDTSSIGGRSTSRSGQLAQMASTATSVGHGVQLPHRPKSMLRSSGQPLASATITLSSRWSQMRERSIARRRGSADAIMRSSMHFCWLHSCVMRQLMLLLKSRSNSSPGLQHTSGSSAIFSTGIARSTARHSLHTKCAESRSRQSSSFDSTRLATSQSFHIRADGGPSAEPEAEPLADERTSFVFGPTGLRGVSSKRQARRDRALGSTSHAERVGAELSRVTQ